MTPYDLLTGGMPVEVTGVRRVRLGVAPMRESKKTLAIRKRKVGMVTELRAERMRKTAIHRAVYGRPKKLSQPAGDLGAAAESVIALLRSLGGPTAAREVCGHLGVSPMDIRCDMAALAKAGRVCTTGSGVRTLWWLP